jgi:stage V sporulation protein G
MRVTEVRVKLNGPSQDRLRGFCTITFDGSFVVRDVKIIDGSNGVFVAMPSRKLMDHCPRCRTKNHLRARFCNHCGTALDENRNTAAPGGEEGRTKLHCDVAHPINAACRGMIQEAVLKAFQEELEKSKQPGYVPQRLEDVDDDFDSTAVTPPKP